METLFAFLGLISATTFFLLLLCSGLFSVLAATACSSGFSALCRLLTGINGASSGLEGCGIHCIFTFSALLAAPFLSTPDLFITVAVPCSAFFSTPAAFMGTCETLLFPVLSFNFKFDADSIGFGAFFVLFSSAFLFPEADETFLAPPTKDTIKSFLAFTSSIIFCNLFSSFSRADTIGPMLCARKSPDSVPSDDAPANLPDLRFVSIPLAHSSIHFLYHKASIISTTYS